MIKLQVLLSFILLAFLPAVGTTDSPEQNKALAARMFREILSEGRFAVAAELYAPDFVNHGVTRDVDLAVDQAAAKGWRMAAPDLSMTAELMVSEGDLVAVYWRGEGTNTGEGNGLPATGRRLDGRGMTIWRVVDGKFREEWSAFSELLLMQKLGLRIVGPSTETESSANPPVNPKQVSPKELEENRGIAIRAIQQIPGKGEDNLGLQYSKGFRNHGTWGTTTATQDAESLLELKQVAPDLNAKVQLTVAEGDLVAVLYTLGGTNTVGVKGEPATRKKFLIRGISILRVEGGRIAERWSELDRYEALDQLGLLPPPAPGGK